MSWMRAVAPQVDKLFKVQHTDPWILGDKHRTGRTIQIMNNRTTGESACGGGGGGPGGKHGSTNSLKRQVGG